MEHINKSVLYGVIGLLIGVIISSGFRSSFQEERVGYKSQSGMMHQMSDGTMMSNNGMDMDSMMQGMMMGLEGKTGDAFDKEFLTEMIVHHQGAVLMAQSVLQKSKRPELLKLANDIIAAQTKEINMMKMWQVQWFK